VQDIERELRAGTAPQLNDAEVEASMRGTLDDWRGALRRHVPQSRQMLRKLLVGKLAMTPGRVGRKGTFDFGGEASLGRLLSGVAGLPQAVASPRGTTPFHSPLRLVGSQRAA
jgi:hypothetical protein